MRKMIMRDLICIKHPDYDGQASPVLSCKSCCKIYIAEIKKLQFTSKFNSSGWLKQLESQKRRAQTGTNTK